MKKIILIFTIVFFVLLLFIVISSDWYKYHNTGINFFINNDKYNTSIITQDEILIMYNEEYYFENYHNENYYTIKTENEGFISEEKYLVTFRIINENHKFKTAYIAYLYSFERNDDRSYSIEMHINDKIYKGKVISEGPFNDDGFVFRVVFNNVETINKESIITIKGLDLVKYERK